MIKGLILMAMLAGAFGGPLTGSQQAEDFELYEEVTETEAVLILSDEIAGHLYIRDWEDMLVVEMNKPCGSKFELRLDEGEYVVINIWEGEAYQSAIALRRGETLELTPGMFAAGEETEMPEERIQGQPQKETLLEDRIKMHITGGLDIKSTRIFDEQSVLIGGNIGLTLNNSLYIGVAGYARALHADGCFDLDLDFDAGRPAYGGLVLGYSFFPSRKIHFRVETLLGGGDSWHGTFSIIEPRIDVVLNITQILGFRVGIAMPFASQEKTGLKHGMLNFGIQFGK